MFVAKIMALVLATAIASSAATYAAISNHQQCELVTLMKEDKARSDDAVKRDLDEARAAIARMPKLGAK